MPSLMKNPQAARYGVENGLKKLMYRYVHSAFSAVSALSHAHLRLFQHALQEPRVALLLFLTLSGGVARAEEPLRDPTRPYSAAKDARAASPRFVINAIIISPKRRVAIVNGRRVAVGGSIAGATVVAIEKDQLILDVGGERITAGLNDETTDR